MPIYEYECANCHHTFDILQKVGEAAIKKCPECGKNKVKRLVSAAGFQLKGTGWYVTDFRDKGKKPETKDKPTDSKSETAKPEAVKAETAKSETKETTKKNPETKKTSTKGEA